MLSIIIIFTVIAILVAVLITSFNKIFAVKEDPIVEKIDKLLPQTQCGQCGYPGCLPYAQAIANGDEINKCIPGGQPLVEQLAELLHREVPAGQLEEPVDKIAIIDESTCIGCLHCVEACPVDAILGTKKLLHVIIPDYCTGCELCVEPCPVKCITMIERPKPVNEYSKIRKESNFPQSVSRDSLIKVVNVPPDVNVSQVNTQVNTTTSLDKSLDKPLETIKNAHKVAKLKQQIEQTDLVKEKTELSDKSEQSEQSEQSGQLEQSLAQQLESFDIQANDVKEVDENLKLVAQNLYLDLAPKSINKQYSSGFVLRLAAKLAKQNINKDK